jgi:sugar phosphate isomerase/epimerase
MKTGLCSITFRQLTQEEIVLLVEKSGLDAIEWGGDIHVPPGDLVQAKTARTLTENAGLQVGAYGSYYKILDEENRPVDFQPVLDSALALGADTVRIWAGQKGSDRARPADWNRIVEESRKIAQAASDHHVRIAFEFHNNTLTDSNESAQRLLQEIDHPNIYTYWQPMYWGPDMNCRLQGLELLKDRILNLHVFHWLYDATKPTWLEAVNRRPLKEGEEDWKKYLSIPLPERERFAFLEFVRNDDPSQFLEDAQVLAKWVQNAKS